MLYQQAKTSPSELDTELAPEDQLMEAKAKANILIVEDDMEYEPIWKIIFQKIDPEITFTWATSVSEAEKILNQAQRDGQKWDLIIADIFLSGSRTGLDLWQDWGEPLENMILVSAVDYSKVIDYIGIRGNPPVYIQKPFFINDCIDVISEYLDGSGR